MRKRLTLALAAGTLLAQPPTPEQQKATQEDHRRMMTRLGITELRRGADGRNPQAPNAANYDESKATVYPQLPDPLTLKNGKPVKTAAQWWKLRRPEIVEDFDREVYGRAPQVTPKVTWRVTEAKEEMRGAVKVTTQQLTGEVDNTAHPAVTVAIRMSLTVPVHAKGRVPVILEFGFVGPRPNLGNAANAAPPGPPAWQQEVLDRGWAFAILAPNSVQPDNGAGLAQGIIGLVNKGQPRQPDDWGALRAWAWGASRAIDHFESDQRLDARRVSIDGHSRYGKAALVAMAYEPRIAMGYISSSGAGGAKLHRRNYGELVENVAAPSEYHWMAGNYMKYAGPLQWSDLPVDAHELVALCAPRPVFIGAGAVQGDGWVDAKGSFLAAVGAGPVYRLLGRKDVGATEFPPIETELSTGDLAFRQHSAGHTPAPNWTAYLKFADRYFGKK